VQDNTDDVMAELADAEMQAEADEAVAAQNLAEVFNEWGEDDELMEGVTDQLDQQYANRYDVCWDHMTVMNPKTMPTNKKWTKHATKWHKSRGTKHRAGVF
jgi:signal-transduction protein with cAMP-binding, CBS, and nucleotidyltransferase domain